MSRRTRKTGPIKGSHTGKNEVSRPGQSEWISIDINDGTWTLNDPNSTLVSTSTSSNGVAISLESDRDSDTWSVSNQTCARWYKRLTTPIGTLMTWDSEFGVEFLVQRVSTNANDDNILVVGLSEDPTDTSNQVWAGGQMTNKGNGDFILKYGGDQDFNTLTGGSSDIGSTPRAYINCMLQITDDRSSDAIEPMGVTGIVLDSDNDALTNLGQNGQNISWNNSLGVYLVVAAGWATSGASSDSSAVWKIWYRLTHSFSKMDPLYIPGGGVSLRGGVNGNN